MAVDVDQVELRHIQAVVGTARNEDPRCVRKNRSEFVEQAGTMIALVPANRVPLADGIIEGRSNKRTRRAALVPTSP